MVARKRSCRLAILNALLILANNSGVLTEAKCLAADFLFIQNQSFCKKFILANSFFPLIWKLLTLVTHSKYQIKETNPWTDFELFFFQKTGILVVAVRRAFLVVRV